MLQKRQLMKPLRIFNIAVPGIKRLCAPSCVVNPPPPKKNTGKSNSSPDTGVTEHHSKHIRLSVCRFITWTKRHKPTNTVK